MCNFHYDANKLYFNLTESPDYVSIFDALIKSIIHLYADVQQGGGSQCVVTKYDQVINIHKEPEEHITYVPSSSSSPPLSLHAAVHSPKLPNRHQQCSHLINNGVDYYLKL